MLARYSFVGGGWAYYDFLAGTQTPGDAAFSFCTATAPDRAQASRSRSASTFPERLTKKAIASILRQQKPDFSYAYGEYLRMMPMHPINRPGGSLGRSQACNLALRLYGDERITDDVLKTWLDRLFARNGWLSIGRKRPDPARIVLPRRRLLLLLRPLVRRPVHRPAAGRRAALLPGPPGPHHPAAARKGRQLVGLPALQLPPAIRHRDGRHDAGALPKSNVAG